MGTSTIAEEFVGASSLMPRPAAFAYDHDSGLMCQVREGDAHAYALLVQRHRRPLIHFLRRLVKSESVAEELAQEVFLRVDRARHSYEPTAKFTTWLFRIGTHVAINWLRDDKHETQCLRIDAQDPTAPYRQVPDHEPTAEQRLLAEVRVREIRSAVDSLPVNQRTAVLMHKYSGFAYAQIAATLNCSEPAVKSLLFRAYERLRSRLAHFDD